MFQSLRARFIALFAALVLAPIAILGAIGIVASRRLADNSLDEYEKSLIARSEAEMSASLRELARLQNRTFGGIERRAEAMAAQARVLFSSRDAFDREMPGIAARLGSRTSGWINDPGAPSSIWVPRRSRSEEVRSDLAVLSHVESVLLAEPRGEGMTQWYVIHRSGTAILVPRADVVPTDADFDPRSSIFYEPAIPANNPSGTVVWTEVYNDPVGKGVMISCLAPIGRGADFEGIIGIDVNTEDFRAEIAAAEGSWDYAFLLDGAGGVLLVTPEGFADFGFAEPKDDVERPLGWTVAGIADPGLRMACLDVKTESDHPERIRIGGKDRLLAHRRLDSTGWILGVVADPARFLAPAMAMRNTQRALHLRYLTFLVSLVAALLGSCVLFGWYLTRTVTRPLRRLSDAARTIGAGGPAAAIGPGGPDEIGTLADTLRRMVHDREQAQHAIAESQKLAALGGMASGICHELNNLLAPILGFAQVLSREPLTPDQRAQVERVERAARAAREVVGSLLDSTHELAGVRQPTDIHAVLREALAQLEAARAAAGAQVEWDAAPGLPAISANPDLLQRAFFNIAHNAIQAMAKGPGKRLVIRTRLLEAEGPEEGGDLPAAPRRILVEFEDEGPGIAQEHLGRIFDPFFTTKPPGSGTGLGLSVATSCVRSHRGTVRAENRPEGGARFSVILPFQQPMPPRKAPPTPLPRAVALPPGRPRVLVVDDEDSIRILVTHALLEDNEVVSCDGGHSAIELLQSREFDAVVCDLRLRDVTGRQVYTWIRANRPHLARRFLVMTGDTHGDEGRGFLEEFRTPCVTKPFDLDELRRRVRDLVVGSAASP